MVTVRAHSPVMTRCQPSILHMLMEDDTDGKLLYQCSDHPALLQAQQPFAQILSSPFVASNDYRGNTKGHKDLLLGGSGDQSSLSSPFCNGADVVGAFLKSAEEAIRFLPRDNIFGRDDLVNEIFRESRNKKRYDRDDCLEEEVRRTSKAMVMMTEEPEEIGAHEILDELMLRGHETCIKEMENLRIALNDEGKKSKTRGGSKAVRDVVDLPTLLIQCAQAVAANNHMIAIELLKQIKQHASATGDSRQRLAQSFAKGLEARLAGTGNQLWKLYMAERPSVVEFLKAYKMFKAACCFNKIAITFFIMTVMDAIKGKRRLHIVDYGMNYGFQWAGLIRWLAAERNGGQPELKITAIACSQHLFCPTQKIEEQERWLSKCASEVGLPFKFHSIASDWEKVSIKDLNREGDEVLIVNDLFSFRSLMDESLSFDNPSPRDTVLNNIRKMRPDVFIQSIVNRSYGSSFLTRFREALFYYTALFDMFDATMPRESESRLVLEQGWLGRHVLNIIACEGADLVDRPEKYRQWQLRNQRAGLKQLPLKPDIVKVLKDKVKKHHKDFMVCEDGQWLLQGWMGRILFAHSTWVAEGPISD
ncbi:hypothetical protein EJB05_25625, partial [Eragrostis curvula]